MSEKRGIKECGYLFLTGFLMGRRRRSRCFRRHDRLHNGNLRRASEDDQIVQPEVSADGLQTSVQRSARLSSWKFIGFLGGGIVLAIASLVHLISWALEHHETYLMSMFFGLVGASILLVLKGLKPKPGVFASVLIGSIFAWWLVGLPPSESSHTPMVLFLSGMVAITAMILPGISGSFILLVLGQYASSSTQSRNWNSSP